MSNLCPTCGGVLASGRAPLEALADAPVTMMQRIILQALIHAYPRRLTAEFLLMEAYAGAREPEKARNIISIQIHKLRKALRPYGWTVPIHGGGRGNPAMYRLMGLEQ